MSEGGTCERRTISEGGLCGTIELEEMRLRTIAQAKTSMIVQCLSLGLRSIDKVDDEKEALTPEDGFFEGVFDPDDIKQMTANMPDQPREYTQEELAELENQLHVGDEEIRRVSDQLDEAKHRIKALEVSLTHLHNYAVSDPDPEYSAQSKAAFEAAQLVLNVGSRSPELG